MQELRVRVAVTCLIPAVPAKRVAGDVRDQNSRLAEPSLVRVCTVLGRTRTAL